MDKLITVTPPDKVTDEYKVEAKTWTKWDSKNKKKFPYNYTAEEQVLILDGSAELTPDDGSPPVVIGKGDQVTFHKGFKCKWNITKRMKKYYTVVKDGDDDDDDDDEGDATPAITCDVCDGDCFAESYFLEEGEQDICPKCYEKEEGKKYAGAEHQKEGEKWVEPPKKKGKKAPQGKKAPPKKKQKIATK